ncbi:LacI family transcriptional regulator [candidate division KSB1 bacterium]|nr:LacI family transcriptional regulator [candidate division KSB1 bacterium]
MITIKEIATLAKVSVSTVSKAINHRPDVNETTRQKILALVAAHHFRPNAFGKGLQSRTTESIGVIFYRETQPLSGNPFYSRVLEGIEAELAINNYNLVLNLIPEQHQGTLPKMVQERRVDGLILIGVFNIGLVQSLLDFQIPLVLVDPKILIEGCHQVVIDNEHGAFLATQYLIQRGHARIGFISGDLIRLSFQQRLNGYMKALRFYKIPVEADLVRTGGLENGYELVQQLLDLPVRPTAIFCANDINAIYGCKAIREHDLKIPEDLSLVGFDDIELAKLASPPLTTVRVHKEELGSIAVRALLRIIQNEKISPQSTIVPVRLVERESVRTLSSTVA